MGVKILNKVATTEAIIKKAQTTSGMSINVEAFKKKIRSVKGLKECCKFVRCEPIYM